MFQINLINSCKIHATKGFNVRKFQHNRFIYPKHSVLGKGMSSSSYSFTNGTKSLSSWLNMPNGTQISTATRRKIPCPETKILIRGFYVSVVSVVVILLLLKKHEVLQGKHIHKTSVFLCISGQRSWSDMYSSLYIYSEPYSEGQFTIP